MEALATLIIILALLFLVWWLNLDRPVRSLSRSINTLASAGEMKAANVLSEVSSDTDLEKLKDINDRLRALRTLDL